MARLGIYTLLAGLFVGIFKGISQFMGSNNFWVDLTISKMIGQSTSDAIIQFIPVLAIKNSLEYLIYTLPFFIFLLGLSVAFFFISLFVKNH